MQEPTPFFKIVQETYVCSLERTVIVTLSYFLIGSWARDLKVSEVNS